MEVFGSSLPEYGLDRKVERPSPETKQHQQATRVGYTGLLRCQPQPQTIIDTNARGSLGGLR